MEQIVEGVLRFQRDIYPAREALFRELTRGQSPVAMFIGCSDSRVVPEMLTAQEPGSLFVVRNAGNIVPPYSSAPCGVSATIEYAVAVLGIRDIFVCGHSGCGAMTAMLGGASRLEKLPATARWLSYADAARVAVEHCHPDSPEDERLQALVRRNVATQLDNLLSHPVVKEGVGNKLLGLHGWVFDIGSGEVSVYNAQSDAFAPLA